VAPILADKPALVMKQGEPAEAALGAADETIDSMTKTAVIF